MGGSVIGGSTVLLLIFQSAGKQLAYIHDVFKTLTLILQCALYHTQQYN